MDRPKHRRLVLLGLVLFAGAALLLLGRQWTSAPNPPPAPANLSIKQRVQPQPEKLEPATVEAAALTAPAPRSASLLQPPPVFAAGSSTPLRGSR